LKEKTGQTSSKGVKKKKLSEFRGVDERGGANGSFCRRKKISPEMGQYRLLKVGGGENERQRKDEMRQSSRTKENLHGSLCSSSGKG